MKLSFDCGENNFNLNTESVKYLNGLLIINSDEKLIFIFLQSFVYIQDLMSLFNFFIILKFY